MISTRVFTIEGLVNEISSNIEADMKPWLDANTPNLANILMVGMNIVEKFSNTVGQMKGSDKLAIVKLILPKLIDYAVTQNKLSAEMGEALKAKIVEEEKLVENIISSFVIISKNPELINALKEAEALAKSCFAKLHKKK